MAAAVFDFPFTLHRVGRMRHARNNPPADTKPSFAGRTVLITGANTGVGLEAAVKLVALGAEKLIMGVRSVAKGEAAAATIAQQTGREGVVEVWPLDMADYDSIVAFAKRAEKLEKLDYAVLNAGVLNMEYHASKHGWEMDLQVNALSTTLLALLLLPKLRESKTGGFTPVLELVSSGNHEFLREFPERVTDGSIGALEYWNGKKQYDPMSQYSVSKTMQEVAHRHLAELANGKLGPDVKVISVCPGGTKSELSRAGSSLPMRLFRLVFATFFLRETEEGARTYISALALGDEGHGKFWQNDEIQTPLGIFEGEKHNEIIGRVWNEMIDILRKDCPAVGQLV